MGKKTKTACCGGGDDQISFFLPEYYLIQILVRLPVLSLLRFKSVCKSWLALIQSSFFMDLHTTVATTSNSSSFSKFGTFILDAKHEGSLTPISEFLVLSSVSDSKSKSEESEYGDWYWGADGTWHKLTEESDYGDWYWGADGTWHKLTVGGEWHWDITNCVWYWVPDDEADNDHQVLKLANDDDDQLVLKLDYLGPPPIPSLDMLRYSQIPAGSCNGLICLHDSYLKAVSLWNPATRQFRRLPKSITMEEGSEGSDVVLFGFDVETKDYKVLRVTYTPKRCGQQLEEYSCRAQVYSLSTDSWRLLEGINSLPGIPRTEHCGRLYLNNGTCSFMATTTSPEWELYKKKFIVSYNFTKEIFTTIQFPDHDNSRHLFLCCLGGERMALFTTLPNTTSPPSSPSSSSWWEDWDGSQDCDIWVLNEHGGDGVNKESWNKLHSFQINNIIVFGLTILRGISNDGKFALLETNGDGYRRKMLLYNLVTKEAIMDFLICERLSEVHVFKPSLVSIIGGNGAAAAAPAIE